ncbi:hypothetical protein L9F63_009260, partial [Diploptera punctata]
QNVNIYIYIYIYTSDKRNPYLKESGDQEIHHYKSYHIEHEEVSVGSVETMCSATQDYCEISAPRVISLIQPMDQDKNFAS